MKNLFCIPLEYWISRLSSWHLKQIFWCHKISWYSYLKAIPRSIWNLIGADGSWIRNWKIMPVECRVSMSWWDLDLHRPGIMSWLSRGPCFLCINQLVSFSENITLRWNTKLFPKLINYYQDHTSVSTTKISRTSPTLLKP